MNERETYEAQLNRMFSGWSDAEVTRFMEAIRETPRSTRTEHFTWSDIWREYARRTFPENVVCRRCGSENHTAEAHEGWTGEA